MGVIKKGILGGVSGKVGPVTGSSWKGISYLKSIPDSVADKKSPSQLLQRSAFGGIVSIASAALSVIVKPLWDRFAVKESGYNSFVSANIATMDGAVFAFPEDLIISRGSLTATSNLSASTQLGNGSVDITWDDNSGTGNAAATDELLFLILDVRKEVQEKKNNGITRADGSIVLTFDTPLPSGEFYFLYVAVRKADGTLVSDSDYIKLVSNP